MHPISRRLSLSHLTGTSSLVRGSNLWSSTRSSSAAFSAVAAPDDEVPKSSRRKITKAERKSLLESFVNNYRDMNSGKFPSANLVKKEVGGGYYAVRKAIQVMQFETQNSCTRLSSQYLKIEVKDDKKELKVENTVENTVEKIIAPEACSQEIFGTELTIKDSLSVTALEEIEVAKELNLSTETDPVSSSLMNDEDINILPNTSHSIDVQDPVTGSLVNTEDTKTMPHTLDSKDVPSVHFAEKVSKCDAPVSEHDDFPSNIVVSSATDDKADVITQRNDMPDEESKQVATAPETSAIKTEKPITGDRQHESLKTDDPARDTAREHDVEPSKKAFVWNLKSIADGIISFWKKL